MRLNPARVFLGLLLGVVLAAAAFGQAVQTTGRIEGTIKDSSGGVIPGVTVSLASATGAKSAVSGDSGEYSFPFLTPGSTP